MRYFGLIILVILIISCESIFAQKVFYDDHVKDWQQNNPPSDDNLIHSVFLIGDVKYPSVDSTVILLLKEKLDNSPDESSLLVLGDIVYPRGLPAEDSDDYPAAKADMDAIFESIQDFKGNVVFIPGNHDWQRGQKQGWDRIKTQQEYIRSYHSNGLCLFHRMFDPK